MVHSSDCELAIGRAEPSARPARQPDDPWTGECPHRSNHPSAGARSQWATSRPEGDGRHRLLRLPNAASNLFYGTSIPAAILVLNRAKPEARRGKVLFIHAPQGYEPAPNQSRLRPQDIERIASAFRAFDDEEGFARAIPLSAIEENDFNLNIARYVDATEEEEALDVREALRALRDAERRRDAAEAKMSAILQELGYGA
jgi:hypothetical protein